MTFDDEDGVDWTPYSDLHLINSIAGLRAVGINHHFCMAIVAHRFSNAIHTKVPVEKLRSRLKTFYDFEAAEKLSGEVPFPNDAKPFKLPAEYRVKIETKKTEVSTKPKRSVTTPKVNTVKNTKTPKKSDIKEDTKTPASQKRKSRTSEKETPSTKRRR